MKKSGNSTVKKAKYNPSTGLKLSISTPDASDAETKAVFCRHCSGKCVKSGKERSGKQRYQCSSCGKRQVDAYTYKAYDKDLNDNIISLTKEGVGIRGTARLLEISQNTVMARIKKIASEIEEPPLSMEKSYEVDEIRTYVKKKGV